MMSLGPLGHWELNGNGAVGSMDIGFSRAGGLYASAAYEGDSREDSWEVEWDGTAGVLTLTRSLPEGVTQTYTGYVGGDSGKNPLIAGSFTQSDIPPSDPRRRFGWAAWRPQGKE